jgi:hypothetical protein
VITFRILATSVAEGVGGASSPVSSTFGLEEGAVSRFHFLEIVAFGSGAIFVFFKTFSSFFTSRAACLLMMLTIFFVSPLWPLCQASRNPGIRSLMHPSPDSAFVSAGCRRQQSLIGLTSWCSCQEFHYTSFRSFLATLCMASSITSQI